MLPALGLVGLLLPALPPPAAASLLPSAAAAEPPLFSAAADPPPPAPARSALPAFYLQRRTHAHTRLAPASHCSNATGAWVCSEIFENAAKDFASLGVPAFVRHSHSRGEGCWWPTASGPPASWHPMIQQTKRNLPAEFLAKAKAAGIEVILYHWMRSNEYWQAAEPSWVQRWPNGSAIVDHASGVSLSTCSLGWRKVFIQQIEELIAMGARAFYFDHYPGAPGGDWSAPCRQEFQRRFGRPMPAQLNAKGSAAASREVLEFNSNMTREHFAAIIAAIGATPEPTAALTSVFKVPKIDDGQDAVFDLYETTKLLSLGAVDVAKTEVNIPAGVQMPEDPVDTDILMAFGWSMARDAARGDPPHLWIPALGSFNSSLPGVTAPAAALCAAGAARTYGAIGNLDHSDNQIPNVPLFKAAYEQAAILDRMDGGPLPLSLRPVRHAAVLFSEAARNALFPAQSREAWAELLYPAAGAFGALVRARQPAGLVMDWQLEQDPAKVAQEWGALIAPPAGAPLLPRTETALAAFEAAGGVLVRQNASSGWGTATSRPALAAALLGDLERRAGPAPIRVSGAADSQLHVVAHRAQPGPANATVVYLSNDFVWCNGEGPTVGQLPLPPPAESLVLTLTLPTTTAVRQATDVLGKVPLRFAKSEREAGAWTVEVPRVEQFLAVLVEH